jgi:hypothetical protein
MAQLILKRGSPSRRRADDYDVLEERRRGGPHLLPRCSRTARPPLMWASGHSGHIKRAAHGYTETREAAMAAFAKSWRRE